MNKFIEQRQRLGLNQKDMAEFFNTTQARISEWETGKRKIPHRVKMLVWLMSMTPDRRLRQWVLKMGGK